VRLGLSFPAGLTLAFVLALAGCGGGGSSGSGVTAKTATEIFAATKTAADGATSVHVSGSLVSGGAPLTLDLSLATGKGGRGQISSNGLGFELIHTGGTVYINGSPAFYRHFAGPSAAQLLQGKWLKAPANTGEFASIGSLTDPRKLLDAGLASHGTLTKGATTTINGQPVIAITDGTKGGTIYVATTGKPYPIQITKGGSEGGKITFDQWDVPVSITAPASAIDIEKLKSGH
jgi:hypothetical protein